MWMEQVTPEVLLNLSVFQGLTQEEAAHLAAIASFVRYSPRGVIFAQGDPGDAMYVVVEGQVEVRITRFDHGERALSTLGRDTVLGELAILTREPRSASAVAGEGVTLLRIREADLRRLLEQGHLGAYKVIHNLGGVVGQRLVRMNHELMGVLARDQAGGPVSQDDLTSLGDKLSKEWAF